MERKKIKTITCHEVYNHGASLQEYALLAYLNSLGHEAKVIHYKPLYLSNHFNLKAVSNPKFNRPIIKQLYLLAKLPGRLKSRRRKIKFDAFHAAYIPTDLQLYQSNEELKNNVPKGDVFICGSDQIWNSFFQNGKDPAFYLDFVPDDKLKISYAASFAIDEIDEDLKPFVKQKVERLNHISVRETSGKRILADLGIENVTQVLDPVFLLSPEHWKDKFVSEIDSNFIFIYDFDSNPMIKELAEKLAKEKKLKIFTVNENIQYADENFYLEGPEKFLSLMYHAQFVITNSFHSVAFSLLFKKQFVVVNRTQKINTRMRDLTQLFQLNNILTRIEDFDPKYWIDYENIEQELASQVNSAKIFIEESLCNGK